MIALLFALVVAVSDLERAEQAYRDGEYARALALFEAALTDPDVPEGPVLYNLGNCAYRLERYAEAVLYYRRAALRMPLDDDIAFNRRLAERELRVMSRRDDEGLLEWFDALPLSVLLVLVGGLQTIGLAGFVLSRRHRATMALVALLGFAAGIRGLYAQGAQPSAGVVLARKVSLRLEPHREIGIIGELRAGDTVRIAEMSDRWVRIVHAEGSGWTERGGIGVVD